MSKIQSQKSDIISFQFLKEKFEKIESDKPWHYFTGFYGFFILIAIILACFTTGIFYLQTDVNSARYLLSSIIQSEAAIIAIVITLTLVAVQLTSSTYGPRVANYFTNSPHMYLLFGLYTLSIAYTSIILQSIKNADGAIPPSSEILVSFAFWFEICIIAALLPYIIYALKTLKPENTIETLTKKVTTDTIIHKNPNDDVLDSIFDILHGSIMKYDITTVRNGLRLLTPRIIDSITEKNENGYNVLITEIYCRHLRRCGQQAGDLRDTELMEVIIKNLGDVASHTASLGFDNATLKIFNAIREIEAIVANREMTGTFDNLILISDSVGKMCVEKNLIEAILRIVLCLEQIGKHIIEKINPNYKFDPLFFTFESSIDSLSDLAKNAIREKNDQMINIAVLYLHDVGEYALKKESISFAEQVAFKILELWENALKNNFEGTNFSSDPYLALFVKREVINKWKFMGYMYEQNLLRIGLIATEKNLSQSQENASNLLAELRKCDPKNFESATKIVEAELTEESRPHYTKFLELQEKRFQKILEDRVW